MMRLLSQLAITFLLVLSLASPSLARVAAIQATAPLKDHSEQSVTTAVKEAVETAVRVAVAMGLPWVKVHRALLGEDAVSVEVLATEMDPEEGENDQEKDKEENPQLDEEAGRGAGQSPRLGL